MGISISPRHIVFDGFFPFSEWPLDWKIDLFVTRIDGWHLEVADRCINGWKDANGRQCISVPLQKPILAGIPNHGWEDAVNSLDADEIRHHIPDAGWAVLQIVINYFEVVGHFKCFKYADRKDQETLFSKGVFDVFPEFTGKNPNVANILWRDLRAGLYHGGVRSGRIFLQHNEPPEAMNWNEKKNRLDIDPHVFVKHLRHHLHNYANQLRNLDEKDLRAKFEAAFNVYYEH